MVTGDGAYIKKINRSVILQRIIEQGMISRADLSKQTGLNKATISVQVANLLEEDLIYETQQEHNAIGRRPIMLSINRKAGYVLGIDLDYTKIQYTLSDLLGYPVHSEIFTPKKDNYQEIVHILARQINKYDKESTDSRYGLVGVMIGIHGTVNIDEHINFVPKFQWHHKNLKADLQKEVNVNISIENSANLSAYAESVYKHHQSDNLLAINLSSGIGAGIIIDGELHKGYHGYAGEMGHMIISPGGKACRCGNHGCWEMYNSEPSLFAQLAEKLNRSTITHQDMRKLIANQDPTTLEQMDTYIDYLSIGLNNTINLYNPETIVLNCEVLQMYPNIIDKIEAKLTSNMSQYREITLSELGSKACGMGANALAIQRFLEVPELFLTITEDHIPSGSTSEMNVGSGQ
ncbi:ROK family transcriptional regulator [Virgibacillus sp. NKC19-3]|uniref:ROK family transcriptional regulator n=1 Tax=Virgibacillus saliphilus TaxID=2831674 RepID=UPI001C9ACC6A|nr:ROK family transcriptional regulator [Virgibacillus sp. NKC19-3]MBY7142257.1 ROK family transcriptional regulator [Virgibacillus sp. NKC19-3]